VGDGAVAVDAAGDGEGDVVGVTVAVVKGLGTDVTVVSGVGVEADGDSPPSPPQPTTRRTAALRKAASSRTANVIL
jgi:hypothetical protein